MSAQPLTENKMGTMPIAPLLFSMSAPMMASMLIQALYNVVDSMFVASLSETALTAVSLAYPVQNFMIAVATGTGVGVNALLSRNLGERNFETANRVAGNAIFLSLMSYLLFLVLGCTLIAPYFTMQTNDPLTVQMGKDYLFPVMAFSFGLFGQIMLSRLLQSTGKTFFSMLIQMVGAVVNIVLDPIMIFGLFGCPALGVAGAAFATVLSQFLGLGLGVYFNLRHNSEITYARRFLRPSAPVIARIYSVGLPSILLQVVMSVLTFGLNQILMRFSETAVAVYSVYFKLQGFVFLPIIGMNNGMVPIIAYNYGAKKPERMLATIRLAIFSAVAIMVVGLAVFQLFTAQLLGIFSASPEMLEMGIPALRTMSWCFLIGGFTIVCSSVFQALGKGLLSMTISVVRQLVLVLPLAAIFASTGMLSRVWLAFPLAEVGGGLLAAVFLVRASRSIRSLRQEGYVDL